jgi:D-tyrosyl-tRNA(Tyr) deacylase
VKAVVSRVEWARVSVDGEVVGRIGAGLLVYAGAGSGSTLQDAERLADRVAGLRIFSDEAGRMSRSLAEIDGGGILAISNFTLYGDAWSGRRPSFSTAAPYSEAEGLFRAFIDALDRLSVRVEQGVFGGDMRIESLADGPVNLILECLGGLRS